MLSKTLATLLFISIFQGCEGDKTAIVVKEEQTTPVRKTETASYQKDNLVSKKEFLLQTIENGSFTVVKEGANFLVENSDADLVLFDFFTTWCPACRSVAPHLANLQKKYPKKLLVLGVLIEEGKTDEDILEFRKRHNANYSISNSTGKDTNYANFKFSNEIASLLRQPRSFPIPLLVMFKNGKYFTHYVGAVPEEMIESDIKEALNLRGK